MTAFAQFRRAILAELTRAGGRRSLLLLGAVPGAILLPLVVTVGIAIVAERFASISGSIQVTSVETTNSIYWVITFTATVFAVIAAYAQVTAERGPVGEVHRYLYPRGWVTALARWVVYGALAAACSLVLVCALLLILPTAFPAVYAMVDISSDAGIRFLWAVPAYSALAVGIGIGLAGIVGHPAGTVVILLAWIHLVENVISLVPNGFEIQLYMPFLNGTYGTGQELAFLPPWGFSGALAYMGAITMAVFVVGVGAATLRRRRG
ncbi:ABC transporter permease [Gordonia sp. ABSL1-1]|uniref:ABC transporter permease n=1 Tax=Gordonia sp. ABSL1-1 TaxID=3053923 RepID=UPI0025722483|nr:ABC transporter permease [Gordonia sp. ABSL1-1]MDL9936939.1 ABC transporter permease [Gordonia sp. ABSL1-1]